MSRTLLLSLIVLSILISLLTVVMPAFAQPADQLPPAPEALGDPSQLPPGETAGTPEPKKGISATWIAVIAVVIAVIVIIAIVVLKKKPAST